jgi:hypothetical protein
MATAIWALSRPCQWLVTAAKGDQSLPIIGAISAYSMVFFPFDSSLESVASE